MICSAQVYNPLLDIPSAIFFYSKEMYRRASTLSLTPLIQYSSCFVFYTDCLYAVHITDFS